MPSNSHHYCRCCAYKNFEEFSKQDERDSHVLIPHPQGASPDFHTIKDGGFVVIAPKSTKTRTITKEELHKSAIIFREGQQLHIGHFVASAEDPDQKDFEFTQSIPIA